MVTRSELAQHLNVSVQTIMNWTKGKKMPAKKYGGRYMYDLDVCGYWVKKHKPWMVISTNMKPENGGINGQN